MKVIISRKGFDDQYGGSPSPILPNGKMITIPIPCKLDEYGTYYKDINIDKNFTYYDLMQELNIKIPESQKCHLDPDLRKNTLKKRKKFWKPIFGQSHASSSHLKNNNVKKGDIFIFFGTFQHTKYNVQGNLEFDKSIKPFHAIFGYLIVDKIYDIGSIEIKNFKKEYKDLSWTFSHPHLNNDYGKNNILYISSGEKISNKFLTAGYFKYNQNLILSKKNCTKSIWELPICFENIEMSYHNNKDRWSKENNSIILKTVSKGQEFVIKDNILIERWAKNIILNSEKF